MPNVLVVTGNTRLTWSLSDQQAIGPVGRSAEQKSGRSITHGTGPNQANVAYTNTFSIAGMDDIELDLGLMDVSAFGFGGLLSISKVKELLIEVTTGPTGGYVTVRLPAGITGIRVNAGGQFHWIDYLSGLEYVDNLKVENGITGTYGIELSLVGNGYFWSYP
jgi:hypothetical protein